MKLNSWYFLMILAILSLNLLMVSKNLLRVTVLSLWRSIDRKNRFVINEICKLISIISLISRIRHRNLTWSLNRAMPCCSKENISYVCFYLICLWGKNFLAIWDQFWGLMGNWNKLTRPWKVRVCIFQLPIDPKIRQKFLGKCKKNSRKNRKMYRKISKEKFNKSTHRICLIYFNMLPFIDKIKFPLWNLNINVLMLINFHISLITKRFFQSFGRHSDKTLTLSELLPYINKFRNKILDFFRKFHECGF